MKLGRERREGLGRVKTVARPSLFSFSRHFLRTRLLGIITRLTSREKADCEQSMIPHTSLRPWIMV